MIAKREIELSLKMFAELVRGLVLADDRAGLLKLMKVVDGFAELKLQEYQMREEMR